MLRKIYVGVDCGHPEIVHSVSAVLCYFESRLARLVHGFMSMGEYPTPGLQFRQHNLRIRGLIVMSIMYEMSIPHAVTTSLYSTQLTFKDGS